MTDLEIAKTNYELAVQIFANNPTSENCKFYHLQQDIFDHVYYGKMSLKEANKTEKRYYQTDNFNNVIAIYKKP